tara:strand:+ start:164 stop:292 length:129 start_codon:yes stop_codon:yes gene_type:complete
VAINQLNLGKLDITEAVASASVIFTVTSSAIDLVVPLWGFFL